MSKLTTSPSARGFDLRYLIRKLDPNRFNRLFRRHSPFSRRIPDLDADEDAPGCAKLAFQVILRAYKDRMNNRKALDGGRSKKRVDENCSDVLDDLSLWSMWLGVDTGSEFLELHKSEAENFGYKDGKRAKG